MKLQQYAAAAGGEVSALLGNHELMILCAYRFPDAATNYGQSVTELWQQWGGVTQDLTRFSDEHTAFIETLPTMALEDENLLIHADSMVYVSHGVSIENVNRSFQQLMQSSELDK